MHAAEEKVQRIPRVSRSHGVQEALEGRGKAEVLSELDGDDQGAHNPELGGWGQSTYHGRVVQPVQVRRDAEAIHDRLEGWSPPRGDRSNRISSGPDELPEVFPLGGGMWERHCHSDPKYSPE